MAFDFTRPVDWLPGLIGGTQITAARLNLMQDSLAEQFGEALAVALTTAIDPTARSAAAAAQTTANAKLDASARGATNGVAPLTGGKVPAANLPSLVIGDTFVVASQAAMLALTDAEQGDVAVRTDQSKTYILKGTTPGTLSNWTELLSPTAPVQSVAGRTGAVTLAVGDVANAVSTGDSRLSDARTPTGPASGEVGGTFPGSLTVPGLANRINVDQKGVANGVATLGSDGKVPAAQLPASSGSAPRMVRGLVRGDGSVQRGTGFTVAKPSVGQYTVTFTTSFGAPIAVLVGPYAQPSGGFSNVNATLANEDTWTNNGTQFKVYVTNAGGTQFIDAGFTFLVLPVA